MSSRPSTTRRRTIAWSKGAPFGAEFAIVELTKDRLKATGVAIGSHPEPYKLDYTLQTTARYVTTDVVVMSAGDGWWRKLELRRDAGSGLWTAKVEQEGEVTLPEAGGDLAPFNEPAGFADVYDPDLGLSPLFNTMPVLRHGLHEGGSANDFLMVWISVPDLGLHPSPQRYTHLKTTRDDHLVRFESVGDDFVADVVFNSDGLVVDYPGVASRLRATDRG